MQHETVNQMFQRYHNDKAKGVKHTPLHTLQECCEEAGIDYRWFGRVGAKQPGAPQPVLQHAKNVGRSAVKYYRKHEFVQWVNQVRKQKEKAVPDIKTALETALSKTANAWAADDEAHQQIEPQQEKAMTLTQEQHHHSVTNNVSRTTFNYIRDNPNTSRARIMAELTDKGFKYESVATLISQMIRCNMVAMGEYDTLTTLVPEYVPIKSSSKPKKVKAVAAPAPRKHVEIVNTRTGEVFNPKPVPEKEWSPSDVIDKLSVRQALALFKELRNILVG